MSVLEADLSSQLFKSFAWLIVWVKESHFGLKACLALKYIIINLLYLVFHLNICRLALPCLN